MTSKIKQVLNNNTFIRNFSFLAIGQILARAINMFTCILLARWLAPTGYGKYTLVLTYIALFSAVASVGMHFIINKYVALNQNDSKRYLYISWVWRLVGYIVAATIFVIYSNFAGENLENLILYSVIAGVFLDSLWSSLQSISFGMQRMEWNSILEVATAAITALLYILLQFIDKTLITPSSVIVIYISLFAVRDIVYYIVLNKKQMLTYLTPRTIEYKQIRQIFKEGFPFYILVLLAIFTNQLPILFLERNSNIEEVAFFNTANKLLLPMTILLNTSLTALFPNQAQLYCRDKHQFWKRVEQMFGLLVVIGCTISFVVTLFQNEISVTLFGERYVETGSVMAMQCWYFVFFALFSLNGNALGASGNQKLLSLESFVYALFTTPVVYFSSFYGAEGLARGYVVASFINILYLCYYLIKKSESQISVRFIGAMMLVMFGYMALSFLTVTVVSVGIRVVAATVVILLILVNIRHYLVVHSHK